MRKQCLKIGFVDAQQWLSLSEISVEPYTFGPVTHSSSPAGKLEAQTQYRISRLDGSVVEARKSFSAIANICKYKSEPSKPQHSVNISDVINEQDGLDVTRFF